MTSIRADQISIYMKYLSALILALITLSCDFGSPSRKNEKINQDLAHVADSISKLMSEYHYNPAELSTDKYIELEEKIRELAGTAETKEEFIKGFNTLWQDGPFSHVRLAMAERPAGEMADFIDSLRVGDHTVSLEWVENTAVLTLTTMTGVDTKEGVFKAYQDIAANKPHSLIIDLRNNTGGTFAGVPLVGHVLTDSADTGMFVSRKWWTDHKEIPGLNDIQDLTPWQGWSIKSFWHDVQEVPLTRVKFMPMEPHFDGQVYVLTSKQSASAAEFAVDALAQADKVTIIGETTAGEMLSQKMYDLPHDFQLSLPIAEYYSTRIGRIEGRGVEPDISIDQSVAMELAFSLIDGEPLEVALSNAKQAIDEMKEEPFDGEKLYLFGNMNDWGKKWRITPQFEYKGKGIYETSSQFKKGRYEFKIAPMSWDFDYGAVSGQEYISVGQEISLAKVPGSSNLVLEIESESELHFSLYVRDIEAATLEIVRE